MEWMGLWFQICSMWGMWVWLTRGIKFASEKFTSLTIGAADPKLYVIKKYEKERIFTWRKGLMSTKRKKQLESVKDNCLTNLLVFGLAMELSWIWIVECQRVIVIVEIEASIHLVSSEKRVEAKGWFGNDNNITFHGFVFQFTLSFKCQPFVFMEYWEN